MPQWGSLSAPYTPQISAAEDGGHHNGTLSVWSVKRMHFFPSSSCLHVYTSTLVDYPASFLGVRAFWRVYTCVYICLHLLCHWRTVASHARFVPGEDGGRRWSGSEAREKVQTGARVSRAKLQGRDAKRFWQTVARASNHPPTEITAPTSHGVRCLMRVRHAPCDVLVAFHFVHSALSLQQYAGRQTGHRAACSAHRAANRAACIVYHFVSLHRRQC